MDKSMLAMTAAILSTLAETDGCPESTLYLLVDCEWQQFEKLKYILLRANLVQIKSHFVTLTDKGKSTAAAINKAIPAAK